ncbi:MAG: glycosyltransferase family 4 protein [Xenococcaceae cyanobacterium MO_188.B32]|nr:glycosyltransferase family 4 protein [Xenococcaceae cyanobacterium MO_188.B32]
MKQRKILFVDHAAVLGGAELHLLDIATAYKETSRVFLFTDGAFRHKLEAAGIKVRVAQANQSILNVRASSGLEAFKVLPNLWKMAGQVASAARGFDLIHANSQKAFVASALATFRGSPPVVWHLQDILTAKHFSSINRRIAVWLANNCATRVIVNSEATGKAFVAAGGREELVRVVYNGFDSTPFDRITPEQAQQIRTQLGIKDVPVVGVFSRLSYWKGQHILLEAIRKLPEVHALLVGEALFGEEEYVTELKSLAAVPELAGRVHWLGFRDDVPVVMKACDIIVHTSTEPEPFGRVIVEGMLAQRPVIATAAGGAIELIEDRVTGRLVPPGDAKALAKTIKELLDDRTTAIDLGKQGYKQAKTNFSLETILTTFDRALPK